MATVHPSAVTTILMQRIRDGVYAADQKLPTLDELNEEFFDGLGTGPKPGRSAYAPLIAAGMVKAIQGRAGGHFLTSSRPAPVTAALSELATHLQALTEQLESIRDRRLYLVEFQHVRSGQYFGQALHASRLAAEESAIGILVRLGESVDDATRTAAIAGATITDVRADGYGVRICGHTLGGDIVDLHGREE